MTLSEEYSALEQGYIFDHTHPTLASSFNLVLTYLALTVKKRGRRLKINSESNYLLNLDKYKPARIPLVKLTVTIIDYPGVVQVVV